MLSITASNHLLGEQSRNDSLLGKKKKTPFEAVILAIISARDASRARAIIRSADKHDDIGSSSTRNRNRLHNFSLQHFTLRYYRPTIAVSSQKTKKLNLISRLENTYRIISGRGRSQSAIACIASSCMEKRFAAHA